MLRKDIPKRLVLVNKKPRTRRPSRLNTKPLDHISKAEDLDPKLKKCGKSRSLDSSDIFHSNDIIMKKKEKDIPEVAICDNKIKVEQNDITVTEENTKNNNKTPRRDLFCSPLMRKKKLDNHLNNDIKKSKNNQQKKIANEQNGNIQDKNGVAIHTQALANLEKLITRLREDDSKSSNESPRLPKSSPSSPTPSKKGKYVNQEVT